jgi:NADPH:quinone reductase-like Zn-dependent oxidoreductase
MATAVVATAFGGPEVLSLIQVPVSPPGPGEVQIEVRAAGVNPVDYKSYAGTSGADPSKLPMLLGYELSGVVVAVGDGAEGPAGVVHTGDAAIAYPVTGAYATEVVTKAGKSSGISHIVLAAYRSCVAVPARMARCGSTSWGREGRPRPLGSISYATAGTPPAWLSLTTGNYPALSLTPAREYEASAHWLGGSPSRVR